MGLLDDLKHKLGDELGEKLHNVPGGDQIAGVAKSFLGSDAPVDGAPVATDAEAATTPAS